MTQVIKAITDNIAALCESCGLTVNHVADGGFQCFTQGAHEITFRAHIYATPTATLQQLIAHVSHWVKNGASIAIDGLLLTIDRECDIVIASFSEPECYGVVETSEPPILTNVERVTTETVTTTTVPDSITTLISSKGSGTTSQQMVTSQAVDKTNSLPFSAETIIVGGVVVIVLFIIAAMVTIVIIACICAKYCR